MAGETEIRSAATVISAVLETMGLVTQERILNELQHVFLSGGALIYLVVCIGAIASIAFLGSYRMGVYLLVGPGIFYFLLFTRATVPPTEWKLGGGEAVSVEENFTGYLESYKPKEDINVSWFFRYYTRLIDKFVNSSVDLILKDEEIDKVQFLMRDHVLRLMRTAVPTDEGLQSIIVADVMGNCAGYMNVLTAFTGERYSDLAVARLKEKALLSENADNAVKELMLIDNELAALRLKLTEVGAHAFTASPALRKYIATYADRYYAEMGMSPESRANQETFVEKDIPRLAMTCSQLWSATTDYIRLNSDAEVQKIFQNYPGEIKPEDEQKLCQTIATKLYARYFVNAPAGASALQPGEECDLGHTVALFMLRNIVSNYSGLKDVLQQQYNNMRFFQGSRDIFFNDNTKRDPNRAPGSAPGKNDAPRFTEARPGHELDTRFGADGTLEGYDPKTGRWRSFEKVPVHGFLETAYTFQQSYRSKELMQKAFTYGLHMPYWQGVLLYFFAMAYPFTTILALMPNRVTTFLYMPLFWLWVKSWDIGFAMVMVVDRMLWNLVPSTTAQYNAFPDINELVVPGSAINDPTILVRAALSVDPLFHVHIKYHFLTLAMTMVPVVTGYVLLKGKRAVVASFVDAPREHADHSAQLARQSFEVGLMNEMMQEAYRFAGAAGLSETNRGDGALGGVGSNHAQELAAGVGQYAMASGAIDSVGKLLTQYDRLNADGTHNKGKVDVAGGVRTAAGKVLSARADVLESYATYQSAAKKYQQIHTYWFDSELGRTGDYAMKQEATMTAAADGVGFEFFWYNTPAAQETKFYRGWREAEVDLKVKIAGGWADVMAKLPDAALKAVGNQRKAHGFDEKSATGRALGAAGSVVKPVTAAGIALTSGDVLNTGEEIFEILSDSLLDVPPGDIFIGQMENLGYKHGFSPSAHSPKWDGTDRGWMYNIGEVPSNRQIGVTREELTFHGPEDDDARKKRQSARVGHSFWEDIYHYGGGKR